ncbi:hypothetical protein ALC57_11205, partial [Trachymyrmex cornetzi]
TYTGGRGDSVINYVLVDEETRKEIESMEIGEEINSDHHSLVVSLRGGRGRKREKGGERRGIGRLEWSEGDGNERMKEMGERIKEILGSIEKERGKEMKGRGWRDEECTEKKVEVRRVLREWRKGKGGRKEYWKQKKEYKELYGNKKKEENDMWERKVEGAKNEGQVWEIVNRERKKWKRVNKGIEMREWEEYFKELLAGMEGEVMERLQDRYSRWVLGVEGRTPGYMIREEIQREKLRGRAGKKAWAFEER